MKKVSVGKPEAFRRGCGRARGISDFGLRISELETKAVLDLEAAIAG
jgi:hypothetical protein